MSSTSPPREPQRPAVPWWLRWAAMVAGAGTFAWSTAAVLRGGRPDQSPAAPAYPQETRRQAVAPAPRKAPQAPSGSPGTESDPVTGGERYRFHDQDHDRFVDSFSWKPSEDRWEHDSDGWDEDGYELHEDGDGEHSEQRGPQASWSYEFGPGHARARSRPPEPSGSLPTPRPPDARSRPS